MARGEEDDDEVGYGRPPKKSQFKKGQSGNPKGRPKKTQPKAPEIDFSREPMRRVLLKEAYRPVTLRDGDEFIEMPAIQAIFRSMGLSALKGEPAARKLIVEIVEKVEREEKESRQALFEETVTYKDKCEAETAYCAAHGKEPPEFFPRPEDIFINVVEGTAEVRGPWTKEDKKEWDRALKHRDDVIKFRDETYGTFKRLRNRNRMKTFKDIIMRCQERFDLLNEKFPDHYQVRLDRRYCEAELDEYIDSRSNR